MAKAKDSRRLVEVAPGVKRYEYADSWRLEGTQDALIASGLVKAEWFPTGKRDARRAIEVGCLRGQVVHGRRDKYSLILYKPPSEINPAARIDQEKQDELDIAAFKSRLPPLAGDLSEAEIEHLRVLRALSDRCLRVALASAERLLLIDAPCGLVPLRSVSHLALVVDNDRAR